MDDLVRCLGHMSEINGWTVSRNCILSYLSTGRTGVCNLIDLRDRVVNHAFGLLFTGGNAYVFSLLSYFHEVLEDIKSISFQISFSLNSN